MTKKSDTLTNNAIEEGVANGKGQVTDIENNSYKLAQVEVMNAINKLSWMSNIWALFNNEHKKEFFSELFAESQRPTVPQITNHLYTLRDKYSLKADTTAAGTSDKAARRKARRERMKEENGETGATPKEKTLRGGDSTLILKDEDGQIVRYKVRAKGAPKYKDTGVNRPISVVDTAGKAHDVNLVLNPRSKSFQKDGENLKASNRVGFEWEGKWFIKDDQENYDLVLGFPEKPNKKDRPTYTIVAAGTKIPAPTSTTEESGQPATQEPKSDDDTETGSETTEDTPADTPEQEAVPNASEEPESEFFEEE